MTMHRQFIYVRAPEGRPDAGCFRVVVILDNCVTLRGFRIGNDLARRDEALDELMAWFRAGRIKFRETVAEGFDVAPDALVKMLSGGNIGKQVVRLARP
jgi:NADPH-dependent curcumin reductase CurA